VRVAYLIGRYPATSHAFIAREIAALRERGVDIHTFSIWATRDRDLPSLQDRQEAQRTRSLLPLNLRRTIRAHWRALSLAPGAYAKGVARAVRLGRPGMRGRSLGATWFLEAIVLWQELRRRGIRHLHVHLNGTAPSVALVLTSFANAVEGSSHRWSWSMTVHGSSEFYDVYGERLADKVQGADAVICVGDFARSQLMAHVDEQHWSKLHVVHCGIDLDAFAADHTSARSSFRLLIVARLTRAKGHAVLLESLAELGRRGVEVELTIVGDGPKRGSLEGLARELGVGSRTSFTGAVGRERMHGYYREADAFCLPSFAEGVPVVLMEAMAAELPVVATDVMGVRELVDDGVNGILVRPGRADLLADAIARLARDFDLRRRLGRAGRQTVQREFDIRTVAEQIERIFEGVLGSSDRSAPGRATPVTASRFEHSARAHTVPGGRASS
jgi:colanic acid/amylovoran biosynthesis glycosyltransferase